ncbi:hypothetical protein HPB49_021465 [Dermacentor silvarum]|uniref:Uncharacterized protein n=1 Tax=Dermacentor silvarum TaxID=543639 RepID=A0ACB8DQS4_DERSI|nr:hypothetical protein HPB49_021465 [Dermacentor silvarum]
MHEVSAFVVAPHATCKGLIRRIASEDGPEVIDRKVVNRRNPLALGAKRIKDTGTVVVLFERYKVPNELHMEALRSGARFTANRWMFVTPADALDTAPMSARYHRKCCVGSDDGVVAEGAAEDESQSPLSTLPSTSNWVVAARTVDEWVGAMFSWTRRLPVVPATIRMPPSSLLQQPGLDDSPSSGSHLPAMRASSVTWSNTEPVRSGLSVEAAEHRGMSGVAKASSSDAKSAKLKRTTSGTRSNFGVGEKEPAPPQSPNPPKLETTRHPLDVQ